MDSATEFWLKLLSIRRRWRLHWIKRMGTTGQTVEAQVHLNTRQYLDGVKNQYQDDQNISALIKRIQVDMALFDLPDIEQIIIDGILRDSELTVEIVKRRNKRFAIKRGVTK